MGEILSNNMKYEKLRNEEIHKVEFRCFLVHLDPVDDVVHIFMVQLLLR